MVQKHEWFSEEAGFFGPDYLMEYKEVLPPKQTAVEVNFIERILGLKDGVKILDIPCGHGRHAVELAKRGYCVTGVELNKFFIREAEKTAEEVDVSVRFLQCDMRELTFDTEFDVALNLFTAMGYFEQDEDDIRFLEGVYSSLKTGGQFVIDFVNNEQLIKNFRKKSQHKLTDGSVIITKRSYHSSAGRIIDQRTKVDKDGSTKNFIDTRLRLYTSTELIKMSENVGFVFEESFGGFDGSHLGSGSKRVILHFKKG